jgi:integrase
MPLTVKELDALKPQEKPYRVLYEKGLYLEVKPTGAKSWVFRFTRANGSRTWMGLGGYPELGAAKAALKAGKLRADMAEGIDPLEAKREARHKKVASQANTLRKVAEEWYQYKLPSWSSATAGKCRDYLDKDILPELGDLPIASIEPGHTAALMKKIEERKAFNVAKKVRQWLRAIFSYAIAHGLIKHNPASELTSIAAKAPDATHYPWLTELELPPFLRALSGYTGRRQTLIACKLVILTGCRPGVIRAAEWTEFDLEKALWTIPKEKMKMRRPHIVPLPTQALTLLQELKEITGSYQYLFPCQGGYGKRQGLFISEGTINQAFARIGYKGRMTGHGSRHTASTLLNEHATANGFSKGWINAQLSHKTVDEGKDDTKISREYNHAIYLDARKKMMQWYADYLEGLETGASVPLHAERSNSAQPVKDAEPPIGVTDVVARYEFTNPWLDSKAAVKRPAANENTSQSIDDSTRPRSLIEIFVAGAKLPKSRSES